MIGPVLFHYTLCFTSSPFKVALNWRHWNLEISKCPPWRNNCTIAPNSVIQATKLTTPSWPLERFHMNRCHGPGVTKRRDIVSLRRSGSKISIQRPHSLYATTSTVFRDRWSREKKFFDPQWRDNSLASLPRTTDTSSLQIVQQNACSSPFSERATNASIQDSDNLPALDLWYLRSAPAPLKFLLRRFFFRRFCDDEAFASSASTPYAVSV